MKPSKRRPKAPQDYQLQMGLKNVLHSVKINKRPSRHTVSLLSSNKDGLINDHTLDEEISRSTGMES